MAIRFYRHGDPGGDVDYVSTDDFDAPDRPVEDGDAERWPEEWAEFQARLNPPAKKTAKKPRK